MVSDPAAAELRRRALSTPCARQSDRVHTAADTAPVGRHRHVDVPTGRRAACPARRRSGTSPRPRSSCVSRRVRLERRRKPSTRPSRCRSAEMAVLRYDPERIHDLGRRALGAATELAGLTSDDPAAAGAMRVIRQARDHLEHEWLPLVRGLAGSDAMLAWSSSVPVGLVESTDDPEAVDAVFSALGGAGTAELLLDLGTRTDDADRGTRRGDRRPPATRQSLAPVGAATDVRSRLRRCVCPQPRPTGSQPRCRPVVPARRWVAGHCVPRGDHPGGRRARARRGR